MAARISQLNVKAMAFWRRGLKRLTPSKLLVVNTGACCALYALGDIVQQRIEGSDQPHDWRRTARMAALGCIMGPINHSWYVFLDRLLPGATARLVFSKVAADQLVMAPVCCSVFYTGMILLEGGGRKEVEREIANKFWPTYKVDWQFWPAAQVINFSFVPSRYRVMYVNFATLVWTVFLSYMKHKDIRHQSV